MSILSISEAADRLGLSERRVRQLVADGLLQAERKGGAWVLDAGHVDQVGRHRRPSGRPWSAASAWAVLALAAGDDASLSALDRSRARRRLAEHGLEALIPRLASRAEPRSFYAHPSALRRLENEDMVVRSGISAVELHDVVAPESVEGYVPAKRVSELVHRYKLDENAARPNVLLRLIADDLWPFRPGVNVAPPLVVAVDLLEADDERSRRAGAELARP